MKRNVLIKRQLITFGYFPLPVRVNINVSKSLFNFIYNYFKATIKYIQFQPILLISFSCLTATFYRSDFELSWQCAIHLKILRFKDGVFIFDKKVCLILLTYFTVLKSMTTARTALQNFPITPNSRYMMKYCWKSV